MKKILLGTTAIVAAGMIAAPSVDAAEKLKVSVGGYMEQWFGYTTTDDQSARPSLDPPSGQPKRTPPPSPQLAFNVRLAFRVFRVRV